MSDKVQIAESIQALCSESALQALANGKGNRAIGTNAGINVGDVYTVLSINFRSERIRPTTQHKEGDEMVDDYPADVWRAMSEEEQMEIVPEKSEWFEFETTSGPLSFGAVLGHVNMDDPEWWKGGKTIEGFNPKTLFTPSARTPKAWIANGVDGLLGKTIKCVATITKQDSVGRDRKYRGFVEVKEQKKRG